MIWNMHKLCLAADLLRHDFLSYKHRKCRLLESENSYAKEI